MPSLSASRKLLGEWAEVCFVARALKLGFRVAKPYGDSSPYDFLVDAGGRITRVQVKSVEQMHAGNTYRITAGIGAHKRPYTRRDLDFIAAYVIPCDAWYIIPRLALRGRRAIYLSPHQPSRRKFEKFRDAWRLLRAGRNATHRRFVIPRFKPSRGAAGPERSRR